MSCYSENASAEIQASKNSHNNKPISTNTLNSYNAACHSYADQSNSFPQQAIPNYSSHSEFQPAPSLNQSPTVTVISSHPVTKEAEIEVCSAALPSNTSSSSSATENTQDHAPKHSQLNACKLLLSLAEQSGSSTETKVHQLQRMHNQGKSMYLNRKKQYLWPAPQEHLEKSWLFDSQEMLSTPSAKKLRSPNFTNMATSINECHRCGGIVITKDKGIRRQSFKTSPPINEASASNFLYLRGMLTATQLQAKDCGDVRECSCSNNYINILTATKRTFPESSTIFRDNPYLIESVMDEVNRQISFLYPQQERTLSKEAKETIAFGAVETLERVLRNAHHMNLKVTEHKFRSAKGHVKRTVEKRITNRKMDWRSVLNSCSYCSIDEKIIAGTEKRMKTYTRE